MGVGAWIYGWGRFGGGKTPPSNDIQETRGWIITQNVCQQKWNPNNKRIPKSGSSGSSKTSGPKDIHDHQLCVDHPAGKQACQGDSGGPVTTPRPEDNRHVLIGVLSMAARPCPVKFPSALQVYFIESIFFRRPKNQISPQMWRTSGTG